MSNMPKIAVALKYDKNQTAPKVTASGRGEAANKIIQLAKEHDVPIYQDKVLAESLVKLGIDMEIPPELYHAVAKVLICISNIDKRSAAVHSSADPQFEDK